MKIAVMGTGTVGRTLASGLHDLGNDVAIGARAPEASLLRDGAVKSLQTVTPHVMTGPAELAGGEFRTFVCGNDAATTRRPSTC